MAFRGLLARSSAALAPLIAIRSYASAGSPPLCLYRASSLIRLRPLVSAAGCFPFVPVLGGGTTRCFSTRPTTSSLNDPSPNWSNRPPKETILLDGCDFEHWLVVMEPPEGEPTRDEIIDSYIKTLAQVVGSEDEARMKIYSVSTKHYFAFGALVSEELSYKIKALPRVRWVLPDSYLDVKNKDYGGEPFIDGKAVPYDPKYHEEWVRNNARANERSRRNDRPRNFDRSRNFERRRENMQNFQNRAAPPMPNQQFQSNVGPNPPPPRDMPPLGMPTPGVVPPVPPPGNMPPPSPGGVAPPPSGGMPPPSMPYSSQGPGAVPTPPTQGTPSNYPNQGPPYQGNYNSRGTNTGFQGPPVPPGGGAPYQSGGGGYGYPSGGSGPQGGGAPYQSGGGGYPNGGGGHQGGGTPYQSGGGGYPSTGSGFQGGGTPYQSGGGGYSGGSSGHQGGSMPYQTGGGGGGYPGGGNAYQGGGGSFQPGSNPYQGQGRDMPGRD